MNIQDLIKISEAKAIRLEISAEDLLNFSNNIVQKILDEIKKKTDEYKEERLYSRDEVKKIFNICDATLWKWQKNSYLPAIRIGRKVRFRDCDVRKILEGSYGKNK